MKYPILFSASVLLFALAHAQLPPPLVNGKGGGISDPAAFRAALDVARKPTVVFFDDFERSDTANNSIGLARTGHTYAIAGSGASAARIVRGGLQGASPRGTWYAYPNTSFIPEVFGSRFSISSNPGGSTSVVFAMLVARSAGGLDPMIHLVWNDTGVSLEKWPGPGASNKETLWSLVFATPLRRDGTPYNIELRFYPERNEIAVFPPDGSPSHVVAFSELSTYLTSHICAEVSETDTSVYFGRFESVWAWPSAETREDWAEAARAESARGIAPSPLLDASTNRVAAAYAYQAPTETWTDGTQKTIAATTDVVYNKYDFSGGSPAYFRVVYLPAAAAAGVGKRIRYYDLTNTLTHGITSAQFYVGSGSGDSLVYGKKTYVTSSAFACYTQQIEFVSDGVSKWQIVDQGLTYWTASAALDFPSIPAGTESSPLTVTVTGAVTYDGSVAFAAPNGAITAGLVPRVWISSANTVSIALYNATAGAIDPASATWRVLVPNQ